MLGNWTCLKIFTRTSDENVLDHLPYPIWELLASMALKLLKCGEMTEELAF